MIRQQTRSTRTDKLIPNTTLIRSRGFARHSFVIRCILHADAAEYALAAQCLLRQQGDARQNRYCRFERFTGVFSRSSQRPVVRSEEHTSELQSLMRRSYAVF